MFKSLLAAFLLLGTVVAQANFVVPEDCFEDENYCYEVGVVHSQELDRRVIRIEFTARLDASEFDVPADVAELFLDFDAWNDYLPSLDDYSSVKQALKENEVVNVSSHEGEREVIDGIEYRIHYSHSWASAPWPLGSVEIIERVFYQVLEPFEGADYSLRFFPDKSYPLNKGLKHKTGNLHIQYDEEEDYYNIFATVDIIAEIDFLPGVAAPYVGKSFVAIFEGVFSEYL